MTKTLLFAAVSLAAALPFAAVAKTAPSDATAPAAATQSATPSTSATSAPDATAPATSSPSTASPSAATPPAASSSSAGATAATSSGKDASATAPAFAVGTPVKDNTGATIGSISDLKPGASGAQMATISMGQDHFAVATTGLAMQDGSAVINMTQAELQSKLHPAAPK